VFEDFSNKLFARQRPQNLAVHLTLVAASKHGLYEKTEAYVGWTGMASASSLAHFNSSDSGERGLETIEIDPQYAQGLGFALGDVVRCIAYDLSDP
jgi:peroxin-1